MGNILQFPSNNAKFDRMEWLAEQISFVGFNVSIIRNKHNWPGDLAFNITGQFQEPAIPLMEEMKALWDADPELRKLMYEYYFSLGSLYYEASTSKALSFHEERIPVLGEDA